MSGRLQLRRGVVVAEDPLTVEVGGEHRPAWADVALLGEMREGDEVVVNTVAVDLGLGSGGFDVVHVNLSRGLGAEADGREHVIKLNYTSLQHAVGPVEEGVRSEGGRENGVKSTPVLVLPLHGHLAPAAWAFAQAGEGEAPLLGYVQSGGGALPGAFSRDLAELRERGLLAGHVTAGPSYGGEHEAISVAGGLHAAAVRLGWDAIVVGPGPGIIGSDTELGHGGIAALENAHSALAMGMPTLISPRLSSADPRERHLGLSHHTRTALALLLAPVEVAVPAETAADGGPTGTLAHSEEARAALADAVEGRHALVEAAADLDGYRASGLPTRTMGRTLEQDPLFFAAALAAGAALRGKG